MFLTFPTIVARHSIFNNRKMASLLDWFLDHLFSSYLAKLLWDSFACLEFSTFSKLGQLWGDVIQISDDTHYQGLFEMLSHGRMNMV